MSNVRIKIVGAHWSESSLYLLIKCGEKSPKIKQCVLRDNTNDDDDAMKAHAKQIILVPL